MNYWPQTNGENFVLDVKHRVQGFTSKAFVVSNPIDILFERDARELRTTSPKKFADLKQRLAGFVPSTEADHSDDYVIGVVDNLLAYVAALKEVGPNRIHKHEELEAAVLETAMDRYHHLADRLKGAEYPL
jgi:hypothetical protein|tara:strand:+ start:5908 stop:6300 length:393 start_codon:yes stop_codon:yes gene_type:complete